MVTTIAAVSAAIALLLVGAIAGLFYAFSVSVMRALDGIKAEQAIAAMQSINRRIQNPVFLSTFILAPVAAAASGGLLLVLDQPRAALAFFLAATTYAVGTFLPTVAVNVPMNNALDVVKVPDGADEAARLWSDYSSRWTRWNTLRAVFALISLLLVGLALFAWGLRW